MELNFSQICVKSNLGLSNAPTDMLNRVRGGIIPGHCPKPPSVDCWR